MLNGRAYHWESTISEGSQFTADIQADKVFRVEFDPAELMAF